MPSTSLDTSDAIELAELLQFLAGWLTSDPSRLAASRLDCVGHPAYGTPRLRDDLRRFAFLLGGSDGGPLFGIGSNERRAAVSKGRCEVIRPKPAYGFPGFPGLAPCGAVAVFRTAATVSMAEGTSA